MYSVDSTLTELNPQVNKTVVYNSEKFKFIVMCQKGISSSRLARSFVKRILASLLRLYARIGVEF